MRQSSETFFQLLEVSAEELSSVPQLYLPGISLRVSSLDEAEGVIPVTLQQSSSLVFCDTSPSFLDRLQNFDHLLLDLKSMKVYLQLCHDELQRASDEIANCIATQNAIQFS